MARTILSADAVAALGDRASRSLSAQPRSFVRWAGSKRGLTGHLLPHLPESYLGYYEPFLGSGALFFLLEPERAVLNDRSADLMQTYDAIRADAGAVADAALSYTLERDEYYRVRENRSVDPSVRAGEFLYLNRGCWNGLYRVNKAGKFNVPWGAPKSNFVVDKENLLECGLALRQPQVKLMSEDFETALKGARRDDLVFLDPPYVTKHNNNGFVDYNESIFSWNDQVRLAGIAEKLRLRGCHVIITNAHHADVVALYPGFMRFEIARHSTLASASHKRGKVSEVLLVGEGVRRG